MKTSILCLLLLSQLLLGCVALEFDTFTGMRCDTCGIMCGKFCGNRIFKACCYSHNKRSASVHIDTNEPDLNQNVIWLLNFASQTLQSSHQTQDLEPVQRALNSKSWFLRQGHPMAAEEKFDLSSLIPKQSSS